MIRFSSFVIILSILFSLHSHAQSTVPLCIGNVTEYEAKKPELPKLIQALPMILIVDSAFATGAIIVRTSSDGRLILEGRSGSDPHGKKSEPKAIRSACFVKASGGSTQVSIVLEDSTKKDLKIISDTKVKYSIATLHLSDQNGYNAIMSKIRGSSGSQGNDQQGQQ